MIKPDRESMRLVLPVALGVTLGMLAISLVWTLLRGVVLIEAVLWPLALAILLAYIFDPLIDWMTRRLRMSRLIATGLLFVAGYTVLVGILIWLIPVIIGQIVAFARDLPDLIDQAYAKLSAYLQLEATTTRPDTAAASQPDAYEQLAAFVRGHSDSILAWTQEAFIRGQAALSTLFYALTLLVLMPLYTFVFLWKFDAIRERAGGWVPIPHRPRVLEVAGKINTAVASFFRGQLIVCVIVGVLTAVAWSAVGLKFALLLGLLVGVLNLIPFMGALVGLPIACAVALLTGGDESVRLLILVVVCYMVIQALENFVLTPYIQGKAVGLHPITIVVSLLIGSAWMGVLGMLLAVPAAAAVKVLWGEWLGPMLRRRLGVEPGPPDDEAGMDADRPVSDSSPQADKSGESNKNEQTQKPQQGQGKRKKQRKGKGRKG